MLRYVSVAGSVAALTTLLASHFLHVDIDPVWFAAIVAGVTVSIAVLVRVLQRLLAGVTPQMSVVTTIDALLVTGTAVLAASTSLVTVVVSDRATQMRLDDQIVAACLAAWHGRDRPRTEALDYCLQWPPPEPSSSDQLHRSSFSDMRHVGEIEAQIRARLTERQYDHRLFLIPDGFAIITRVERFSEDLKSLPPPARWRFDHSMTGVENFPHLASRVFFPPEGDFRYFLFAVTNDPRGPAGSPPIARAIREMISGGLIRLPVPIAQAVVAESTSVLVLVYDFHSRGSDFDSSLRLIRRYGVRQHLEGAGLWPLNLRN